MTLAGIELRYLVNDINKKIDGYYVSNIYGITKDSLLFKFHHPEKSDVLLMLSTFGIWITKVKIEPIEPNKLLKHLRNNLLRFKLKEVKQIGTERIVYLTLSYFEKEFVIVVELFGDGNIIICNNEMKILALSHSINVRHRQLRVGSQYVQPPLDNLDILNMTEKDFEPIHSTSIAVAKWIGKTLGLPRKYIEEITRLAKVESKKKGEDVSDEEVKRLFDSATQIINNVVNGKHDPEIVRNDEIHVNPISLDGENHEKIASFMDGLDTVFTENILNKGKTIQSSSFTKKISELETRLKQTMATSKTAQITLKSELKKKSRQQELEEYEKKHLKESETNVSWKAYDVKAKRKVEIQNPKAVKMKNGKWAVKGISPITGIKVFRIVGNEKPAVSVEKTADSPKAKKEQTAPAEKPKGSQKTEPEVFSRYYRSPEAESPKVKNSKSKKPNPFCEECGAKIAAKDMFCIFCGA